MSSKTRANAQRKQRFFDEAPWRPQAATEPATQSSENQRAGPPFDPFAVAQGGHHSLAPFSLPLGPLPLLPSHSFSRALATGCMRGPRSRRDWPKADTRNKDSNQTEVRDGAAI
jgi:hypothetical protein